jgi:hypothetical protein
MIFVMQKLTGASARADLHNVLSTPQHKYKQYTLAITPDKHFAVYEDAIDILIGYAS